MQDAGSHHGQDTVSLSAGTRCENAVELQVAHQPHHRGNVSVGQRAHALQGAIGGDEHFPAKPSANDFDQVIGQMGEVAQRLVLDLACVTIGAAQEMGLVDAALVPASRRGYMNCTASSCHGLENSMVMQDSKLFSGYNNHPNQRLSPFMAGG